MGEKHDDEQHEPLIERATDWLNDKLLPIMGPAQLGPYDAESSESPTQRACPLCGHQMGEHRVELNDGHVYLHHPDDSTHEVMETGRHD